MTAEYLRDKLIASHVPDCLHEGLIAYILTGRPTGSFLRAVLENNLYQACSRADDDNRRYLYEIVFFLTNYAPGACWMRPENVTAWRDHRGLEGLVRPRVLEQDAEAADDGSPS